MSKKIVTIIDVKNYVGQEVTIGAWVANKSGKGKIAFLQLRDGSAFFQGVAFKPNFIEKFGEEEGLAKFDTIKKLSQETSVYVTGIVKEDERSKFGYELDITDIEIIGESNDYPITPKEHGTDFLMDNRHLWLRSRKQVAMMQIRNAIIYATYEFFDKNGFMKFDSPILSGNAAEDSTELFETDYFGTPAYLSQVPLFLGLNSSFLFIVPYLCYNLFFHIHLLLYLKIFPQFFSNVYILLQHFHFLKFGLFFL